MVDPVGAAIGAASLAIQLLDGCVTGNNSSQYLVCQTESSPIVPFVARNACNSGCRVHCLEASKMSRKRFRLRVVCREYSDRL